MEKRKPERRDRTAAHRPAVGGRKRAVLGAIQKNRDKRVSWSSPIFHSSACSGTPMANKTRFATASLSFALSGRFTLAFKRCFQTGTSSQTLKRGGLEDPSSSYKHSTERQLKNGRMARSLDETVVEASLSAIGVHHNSKQNVHSTYENAPVPLFIGVRCVSAIKKWVNSRAFSKIRRGCA